MNQNPESDTSNKVIIQTAQNCLLSMNKYNIYFFSLKQTYLYSPKDFLVFTSQQKNKLRINKNHITPIIPNLVMFELFFVFSCRLDAFLYQSIFLPSQNKKKPTNMIFRYFAVLVTFSYLYFEGHVTFELSKVGWYRIAMTWLC